MNDSRISTVISVTLCVLFFYMFIKALRKGKIHYRGSEFDREANPVAFWLSAGLVITCAFLLVLLLIEKFLDQKL